MGFLLRGEFPKHLKISAGIDSRYGIRVLGRASMLALPSAEAQYATLAGRYYYLATP